MHEPLVTGAVHEHGGSRLLAEAADEQRIEDLTAEELTDGGTADKREKVVDAGHNLKQEIRRERRHNLRHVVRSAPR